MVTLRSGLILLAALLGSCAAAPARQFPYAQVPAVAPLPFASAGTYAHRLLEAHNRERSSLRVPWLAWDSALAAGASAYARQLAATGTFQHSNRRARAGVGENLWMGTAGAFSPETMIGNWASEKRWFVPGTFPGVSKTGRWSDVGHYTQMVWRTTSRVGCGVAQGRGREVLVCRYAPAGNIDGRRVL